MLRRRAQNLLALSLILALMTSCKGLRLRQSKWPPPDFYLALEYREGSSGGQQVRQCAQFWADGWVIYREADTSLLSDFDPTVSLPVFCRMCAYKLEPLSVRHLTRLLDTSGIAQVPRVVGGAAAASGPSIAVQWHAFGKRKRITLQGSVYGPMNRALHVVNSFLPPGHGFALAEMSGDVEPSHLQDVPPVTTSVSDSLDFHRQLFEKFPDDSRLLKDAFALACVQGRWPWAQDFLAKLAEHPDMQEGGNMAFPDDNRGNEMQELRRILLRTQSDAGGR